MLALSLAVASNGCPPALFLFQEQVILQRPIQNILPLLSTTRSRADMIRPTLLSMAPYENDDLLKSTTEFYEYDQVAKSSSITRMPLLVNVKEFSSHSILFSLGIDEQWTKHQQILQVLSSRLSGLKENYLDLSLFPDLLGQSVGTDFEFNRFVGKKASLLQEADCDILHDVPSNMSVYPDGQIPYLGNKSYMRDLGSLFAEFSVLKDVNQCRKQEMLVPYFRWNGAIKLRNHICSSSLKLEAIKAAPLKGPGKVKPMTVPKRKNKKAARDRDYYKNSLHAFESLLPLMMDKNRDGKSVLCSLKKSGPELPQLLTQFSATIAGTGIAIIFSVLYKVASGTSPFFRTCNFLTSGFGIGLFWLSLEVNKLRNIILYTGKNSTKLGFEEDEMTRKVEKSVRDIFFRAAASLAVLMLKFA